MIKVKQQSCYRSLKDGVLSNWHLGDNLDAHLKTGYYLIRIDHESALAVGLPLELCGEEHYIVGHLFVTESGTDDKLQKNRTIGQTLLVNSCNGLTSHILRRSGKIREGVPSWEAWTSVVENEEFNERVVWNDASRIDTYVAAGVYNITGERTNSTDGLPLTNAAPGHTIHARLLVLDSSITGTGYSDDKCVTQILTLSNRTGGDGDIYVRTGCASGKNLLAGGSGWKPWGKLQQNIQLGEVTSLNDYIDNGFYSGVYTDGSSIYETFFMVVINNYALAGAMGNVRSISQFKYALDLDGSFSYKTRVGQGNTGISWGEWTDLGTTQTNSHSMYRLSGDAHEPVATALLPLFIAAGAEYNYSDADIETTTSWGETVIHKAGHYYLNGLGDITEEQMCSIYYAGRLPGAVNHYTYKDMNVRTTLNVAFSGAETDGLGLMGAFSNCAEIENVSIHKCDAHNNEIYVNNLSHSFYNCKKLKRVIPIIKTEFVSADSDLESAFYGCEALEEVYLHQLKHSLSFSHSPKISKQSLLQAIQNAVPSSAMTITLHADAHARLADDADVAAALQAQPLVSLVSA